MLDILVNASGNSGEAPETVQKRFWKKAVINEEPVFGMAQPCWRWDGAHDDKGRPRFKFQGKSVNAKKIIFVLEGHDILPGQCVIPICQQYDCVNPAHHVLGTKKESEYVLDGQLCPYYQSILRGAFKARKVTFNQIVVGYRISPPIATAILDEWIPAHHPSPIVKWYDN